MYRTCVSPFRYPKRLLIYGKDFIAETLISKGAREKYLGTTGVDQQLERKE